MDSSVRRAFRLPGVEMPAMLVSLAVSVALFAAGLFIGFQNSAFLADAGANGGPETTWDFGSIFIRNIGAACLLFVGALTGGIATFVTLPLIGLYVGATAQVGVTVVGAPALLGSVIWYVPFEFIGCLVAAAAGLYPLFASLRSQEPAAGLLRKYSAALAGSLLVFAAGAGLILVGAAIETFVISSSGR